MGSLLPGGWPALMAHNRRDRPRGARSPRGRAGRARAGAGLDDRVARRPAGAGGLLPAAPPRDARPAPGGAVRSLSPRAARLHLAGPLLPASSACPPSSTTRPADYERLAEALGALRAGGPSAARRLRNDVDSSIPRTTAGSAGPSARRRRFPRGATRRPSSTRARWTASSLRAGTSWRGPIELAEPGSYLAVDTVPGPVLLLRDGEGRIGAFANSCRHRGARLLDGHGRCRTIVCPYHAWTYGPDGRLLGAPGMQDRPGFDRADWGLTPVRAEVWQGFVFVSFSGVGPRCGRALRRSHGEARLVRLRRDALRAPARLRRRLQLEASRGERHGGVPHRHRPSREPRTAVRGPGGHPRATGTPFTSRRRRASPSCRARRRRSRRSPASRDAPPRGPTSPCSTRPPSSPARRTACGGSGSFRSGRRARGSRSASASPGRRWRGRTSQAGVKKYMHRWETGIAEDNGICEAQQAGLTSILRRPGPFALREPAVHRLNNWVLDQVLDGPGRRRAVVAG